MDQGTHNGIQRAGDGQCDGNEVQRHREGHIQLDGGHHPLGQGHQMGQFLDLVSHQRDIRRIHSDVAANAAHGNAHIRLFQSRSVVDAVTDHAHRKFLGLIFTDVLQLILRQAICPDFSDMQLFRNGFGGVFMVAGQQDRLHAQISQGVDGGGALLPQCAGQGDESGEHMVHRHIGHGAALPDMRFGGRERRDLDAVFLQQFRISGQDGSALHFCAYAAAGDHFKVLRFGQHRACFLQQLTMAFPRGCSENCSAEAASR